MSLSHHLSEEELRALLEQAQQSGKESVQESEKSGFRLPLMEISKVEEAELLQAMKEVIKTLTVRVASLESEVGRLQADLAAVLHGSEQLPPAAGRILIEDAEPLTASAAQELAEPVQQLTDAAPADSEPDGSPALIEEEPAQKRESSLPPPALIPRASRHRKKKPGLFAGLFLKNR